MLNAIGRDEEVGALTGDLDNFQPVDVFEVAPDISCCHVWVCKSYYQVAAGIVLVDLTD